MKNSIKTRSHVRLYISGFASVLMFCINLMLSNQFLNYGNAFLINKGSIFASLLCMVVLLGVIVAKWQNVGKVTISRFLISLALYVITLLISCYIASNLVLVFLLLVYAIEVIELRVQAGYYKV